MSRRHDILSCAAKQQERSRQSGVRLGYDQNIRPGSTTKFVAAPLHTGTADFSLEYYGNSYGSSMYNYIRGFIHNLAAPSTHEQNFLAARTEIGHNGVREVVFQDTWTLNWEAPTLQEKFHFVLTRIGTSLKVYINGTFQAAKEQSEVKDYGDFQLALANSSDVALVRMYDFVLSAAEVAALWNAGDPVQYTLPAGMKTGERKCLAEYLPQNILPYRPGPEAIPAATEFVFDRGSEYYKPVLKARTYAFDCLYRIDYIVQAWEFDGYPSGTVGFGTTGGAILCSDSGWYSEQQARIGELQSLYVYMPAAGSAAVYIYGGNDPQEGRRHLKVQIVAVAPATGIAAAWLDSARQLPLDDRDLAPLLESAGGYDMTAGGTPFILYKTENR